MVTTLAATEENRLAWLTLALLPGVGNRSLLKLIRHFGSPEAVLRAPAGHLEAMAGLREPVRNALRDRKPIRSPESEWQRLNREGYAIVTVQDEGYPYNLSAIPDPPAVLFVRGGFEPRDLVSVAVVGSRSASPRGMAFTGRLSSDLAACGVSIVSGFAVGIDSAAHRGALRVGGRTLAVLGCGLDVSYPASNARLREEVAASGMLISEFPLGTPPAAANFPMRNRIISGLSLGVVVVEAANRSGSLITARLALEQGREVFAVPGIARACRSEGPHRLLREGARLVESAEDILEEIRPLIRSGANSIRMSEETEVGLDLLDEEARLLKHIDEEPRHIDDICRLAQWPAQRVMAVLLALELKGIIRQLPGKLFIMEMNRVDG